MKITSEHFQALRAAIANTVTLPLPEASERDRWDALFASRFPVSALYRYLNDSHISTALRHIFMEG